MNFSFFIITSICIPALAETYLNTFIYLNYTDAASIITSVNALSVIPLGLALGRTHSRTSSCFNISGIRSWMLLTGSTAFRVMTENIGICFPLCSSYWYSPARGEFCVLVKYFQAPYIQCRIMYTRPTPTIVIALIIAYLFSKVNTNRISTELSTGGKPPVLYAYTMRFNSL